MSPRTGRPKIENSKTNRITIRLDNESIAIVKAYCVQENVEKAEAVRRGILRLKAELKK